MNVILLRWTPHPDETVAVAARLCYSPVGISALLEKSHQGWEKLLGKIIDHGHYSVLEHASFTFGIEGISRAATHQLVRHRVASYSQQSQRYVKKHGGFEYIVPPTIADNKNCSQRFEEVIDQIRTAYDSFLDAGIAAEDARYILPNAAETKIVVTMNARELHHFFQLRCCYRAQWEIRRIAMKMLHQVKEQTVVLFKSAGPPCLTQPCPEGGMSCGRQQEIRQNWQQMLAQA